MSVAEHKRVSDLRVGDDFWRNGSLMRVTYVAEERVEARVEPFGAVQVFVRDPQAGDGRGLLTEFVEAVDG